MPHLLTSDFSQPLSSSLILVNGVSWILAFSLRDSLPFVWGVYLSLFTYFPSSSLPQLRITLGTSCTPGKCSTIELHFQSLCLFVCPWDFGGSSSCVKLCVPLCLLAMSCFVLRPQNACMSVAGLFVQGLELAEIPASPALWFSADYFLQSYNRCPPHGTSQS